MIGARATRSWRNNDRNHVQTWAHGTAAGDWVSMAIPSTGDWFA